MTHAAATAPPTPCRTCHRPMLRGRNPGTRGRLRHAAFGLCFRCYNQQHRTQGRRVVDDVAIDRAVAGNPPPDLITAERRAAVRALTRLGLPASVIAERIGCSTRTVVRHRVAA